MQAIFRHTQIADFSASGSPTKYSRWHSIGCCTYHVLAGWISLLPGQVWGMIPYTFTIMPSWRLRSSSIVFDQIHPEISCRILWIRLAKKSCTNLRDDGNMLKAYKYWDVFTIYLSTGETRISQPSTVSDRIPKFGMLRNGPPTTSLPL